MYGKTNTVLYSKIKIKKERKKKEKKSQKGGGKHALYHMQKR